MAAPSLLVSDIMVFARTYDQNTSIAEVVRRRPADMGTIYGHSPNDVHPLTPEVLDRPGWQGRYAGASNNFQPHYTNDDLIVRERTVQFRRPYYQPPALGAGNLSWVDAGPVRDIPTTRWVRNIRPIVGGSHQDVWGKHTNLPTGQKNGNQLDGKKKMVPGRQNRLTVQKYRGQSYSSTTMIVR